MFLPPGGGVSCDPGGTLALLCILLITTILNLMFEHISVVFWMIVNEVCTVGRSPAYSRQ